MALDPALGLDIVEINPILDVRSNSTSLLGAQLALEFMARVADNEPYLRRNGRLAATAGQ